jgi:hypothetical protein
MVDESLWVTWSILVGGVATLAIFSFLIKENPFYRFFEHLFIGIAAGLGPVLIVRDFLWPTILEPMLGLNAAAYPDGSPAEPYQPLYLFYLVPMAFGLLYYCIYSRRYGWLAKVVIGFSLGVSGALVLRGFFAETVPQIASTFKPLVVFSPEGFSLGDSINNIIFVVTVVLVMNYFFFTLGKEGSIQGKTAAYGRPLLMVCFGAFFGSTVMARLALLVERVQFILIDWAGTLSRVFGMGAS